MTERTALGGSSEADRLSDAVDRLTQELNEHSERTRIELGGLQEAIDELRTQLQWACNNILPEFRLRSMAADPLDANWSQKLNGKLLRLACSECDCPSPVSLEAALAAGWSELMQDETDNWEYLGLCPACCKRQDDQVEATRRRVELGEVRPAPIRDTAIDDAEGLVYCCEHPRLAWNGNPNLPGVACESCGYTVAEMGQPAEPRIDEPAPSAASPAVEERVTAAGRTNFLWQEK